MIASDALDCDDSAGHEKTGGFLDGHGICRQIQRVMGAADRARDWLSMETAIGRVGSNSLPPGAASLWTARGTAYDSDLHWRIEFFDMTGRTVAVVTVPASLLRVPTSADRPSARHLAAAEA